MPEKRFYRFDPVTVRAAARIVRFDRSGRFAWWEARFYLRELAAIDGHRTRGASRKLASLASRCASLALPGTRPYRSLRRVRVEYAAQPAE